VTEPQFDSIYRGGIDKKSQQSRNAKDLLETEWKVIDQLTKIAEKTKSENLRCELSSVKRNLLIDFGEFGSHLPDVDIIVYKPKRYKILAVISSKVTLRERIAQTGYWKIKLSKDAVTKHIKVFFVTPDENQTLATRKPMKKGRAIVEVDTDGSYVMSQTQVEESGKVKIFDKFIEDLRNLSQAS